MNPKHNPVVLPGFYQFAAPRPRQHIAQKPVGLIRELVRIVAAGGTVLDPFVGSGTTGAASLLEDRQFVGIELSEQSLELSSRLLSQVDQGAR